MFYALLVAKSLKYFEKIHVTSFKPQLDYLVI